MVVVNLLEYYKFQSKYTHPGRYENYYENLPSSIRELCKIIQNQIIHIYLANDYGVRINEKIREENYKLVTVKDMLEALIQKNPDKELSETRDLNERIGGNCRSYSLFLCSILRFKRIPARLRNVFVSYFIKGEMMDHWVVEYWDYKKKRWVIVDPQIDFFQIKKFNIKFDPVNVPQDVIDFPANVLAKSANKEMNPQIYGFFDEKGIEYIKGNLCRDFLCINKKEITPWDEIPFCRNSHFIDKLRFLMQDIESNFEELQKMIKFIENKFGF